jgi:hypothetical protein
MSRKLSWSLAALAYLGPPAWAHFAIAADQSAQMAAYGSTRCGTPALTIAFLAFVASGALSLLAVAIGAASLWRAPGPRTSVRVLEIGVLAMPLLLVILVFVLMLFRG